MINKIINELNTKNKHETIDKLEKRICQLKCMYLSLLSHIYYLNNLNSNNNYDIHLYKLLGNLCCESIEQNFCYKTLYPKYQFSNNKIIYTGTNTKTYNITQLNNYTINNNTREIYVNDHKYILLNNTDIFGNSDSISELVIAPKSKQFYSNSIRSNTNNFRSPGEFMTLSENDIIKMEIKKVKKIVDSIIQDIGQIKYCINFINNLHI